MIEIDNTTDLKLDELFLDKIAQSLTHKEIELLVTDEQEIQQINKQYRSIDKSTDVLSFPFEEMPMGPLGSIIISCEHVKTKAKELGHSSNDEFSLLFIHGLLHLLGYDHEIDNGEMRDKEAQLIQQFNLPKSLIIRTQE